MHHCPHNVQLIQVNDRVWLCEAQSDGNVVVIVIGPANLQPVATSPNLEAAHTVIAQQTRPA